jgi:hypothetical protein
VSPHDPPTDSPAGALALTRLADAEIHGHLGEGGRSTVYRAVWRGRDVALKVYKAEAVARHARKHGQNLAAYEYERNVLFWRAPGLARYVAEPHGYVAEGGVSALVQERLGGELYYFYFRRRDGKVPPELFEHVRRIVELHHAADLYDIDLHAMNVMVVEEPSGEPVPRLFDFNLVPFHARPRNPIVALALRTGLMSKRARDLRKLRDFHDFRRIEARLVGFYTARPRG